MSLFHIGNRRAISWVAAVVVSLGIFQASLVLAATQAAPTPNPLAAGPNPITSPVPGVDITGAGPASLIHGDPVAGGAKFAITCASCHGDRGLTPVGAAPNEGVRARPRHGRPDPPRTRR